MLSAYISIDYNRGTSKGSIVYRIVSSNSTFNRVVRTFKITEQNLIKLAIKMIKKNTDEIYQNDEPLPIYTNKPYKSDDESIRIISNLNNTLFPVSSEEKNFSYVLQKTRSIPKDYF